MSGQHQHPSSTVHATVDRPASPIVRALEVLDLVEPGSSCRADGTCD